MMKKLTLMLALICASAIASAQRHMSIANLRAVPQMEQITVLDSIVSENARADYTYNEYGYITSYVVRILKDGKWEIGSDSYEQDFTFNADGACTSRMVYALDQNGKRTDLKEKAEVTVENGLRWERLYELVSDKMEVTKQIAYDKWGNVCKDYEYGYYYDEANDCEHAYLRRFMEAEYAGKIPSEKWYSYYDFMYALRTRYVEAYRDGYDEAFRVEKAYKRETVKENGKISVRRYEVDKGAAGPVLYDNLDKSWVPTEGNDFHLSADGKQITRVDYYENWGRDLLLLEYDEIEYDKLGRPVQSTTHEVWDDGKQDEARSKTTITYCDDVAHAYSIDDIVNPAPSLYPEDDEMTYLMFGHVKTVTEEENGVELYKQTYEYDKDWRIAKVTWKDDDERWIKSHGETYYEYNKDGYLECRRKATFSNEDGETRAEFIKRVYNYDEDGIWTDITEYNGESIDGPWTLCEYDRDAKARNAKARSAKSQKSLFGMRISRKARAAAAQRVYTTDDFKVDFSMFEDMSDGNHNFETTNSMGRIEGDYTVLEGEVVSCYYRVFAESTARVPADPAEQYQDPVAPLTPKDESEVFEYIGSLNARCMWDKNNGWDIYVNGTLTYYASDNLIQQDFYRGDYNNIDVSSTKYYLDGQKRLIKYEDSEGYVLEYTYVDDSQYISTLTESGITFRFYYSQRNYLNPLTSIKTIATEQDAKGIYDLQGRRVQKPSSGLYIVNGKKVLVK